MQHDLCILLNYLELDIVILQMVHTKNQNGDIIGHHQQVMEQMHIELI
jgi:hypothetical protein